jgi:uncharacterized protein YecE (DUF72 family)
LPEKQRPKFYGVHKADIDAHIAAKKALSQMAKPIPNTKTVTATIERLRVSRANADARYKQNEAKLKEMEIIRKNLYSIIRQNRGHEKSKSYDLSF